MNNFKFTDEEREALIGDLLLRHMKPSDVFDRIEGIVNDRDGWISVEDPPLEADTDKGGRLLGYDRIEGKVHKCDIRDIFEMKNRFTHWQPLPSPPKQKT